MRALNPVDLSLYLILGPSHWGARDPAWLVGEAAAGGVSLVQYRAKDIATRQMIAEARAQKHALAQSGVPLLINDRVDVALAAGADGVHLGRDDMEPVDARRLLGPRAIIGITVKTAAEARAVDPEIVDYASVGGVFATGSKYNPDPPVGADGLAHLVGLIRDNAPRMPISAIAGIDADNAASVIQAGADGVALVSAIAAAHDPRAAASSLKSLITRALADRARADNQQEVPS
jgi:thiamine-phosphate pyrophosphorylase